MKFQLFVTEACNLNCTYCFEGQKGRVCMNKDMFPAIFDFINSYINNKFIINKDITINFNGGEPLLEFPLIKYMTDEFKKNNINNFCISTNFTLINDEILDFFNNNNFTIQLSIDGKKNTHDKSRKDYNGLGTFNKVFKNIKHMKTKYPNLTSILYSMVFTPSSVAHLFENIKYLIKNDMNDIICSYNAYDKWDKKSIDIYKNQIEKIGSLYRQMYDNGKRIKIKLITQNIENILTGIGKPNCGVCQAEIAILPNGDVLPCGAFINSVSYNNYKICNIYNSIDINMEIINQLLNINEIDTSDCLDCQLLPRCHVKCFAINLQTTGNINKFPDSMCPINKYAILESDRVLDYLLSSNNKTFYDEYKNYIGEYKL